MASRFGPARPRAMGWKGAGGWLTVSQARHENRSRTVWITFHLIGSTSSVSVMSSPSLDSLPPQQGQAVGDGRTTRSRGRWAGRGARTGWAPGGVLGGGGGPFLFGGLFPFGGGS